MWTANLEISKKQGSRIFLLETFCGVGMFLPQASALKSGPLPRPAIRGLYKKQKAV